ncbi:MAG: T9SS type A sorting domain-containing protein [Chitinophagaceae bacterium]|nr:T9SS type A sorting domain-containing protein [Chitinophagaceae bacterium]
MIALSDKQSVGSAITVMNPAKTAITLLNRSAPSGIYTYQLFNSTGQQVSEGKIDMAANAAVLIRLPIQIATGYYTLHLQGQQMRFSQQVLIEK